MIELAIVVDLGGSGHATKNDAQIYKRTTLLRLNGEGDIEQTKERYHVQTNQLVKGPSPNPNNKYYNGKHLKIYSLDPSPGKIYVNSPHFIPPQGSPKEQKRTRIQALINDIRDIFNRSSRPNGRRTQATLQLLNPNQP